MVTRQEWAFEELDHRKAEAARFPKAPHPWSPDWHEYAAMKRERSMRRRAMGYSRGTAADLIAWARKVSGVAE